MRRLGTFIVTLGGLALLTCAGCRTSGGSKQKDFLDDQTKVGGPQRGVWMVASDQTVHMGVCPGVELSSGKTCKGLREDHAPLNFTEYELRLRQSVVNFRAPGAALMMTDPSTVLSQATVQLDPEEESRVSQAIRLLQDSPQGVFSHPDHRLIMAPFIPIGGAVEAMWMTKSMMTPSKITRQTFGAVTPSHTFSVDGVTSERPALLPDGTVVTAFGASIYWLKDGVKRHEFRTVEVSASSPAVLADGTIVVGKGRRVYWLKNGVKRFEFQTGGVVNSSPAVLSDGTIVIGSNDHKVYWLKNGENKFEFLTGGDVRSSPTVLADDTVVIGSSDRKVYWLKDGVKQFEFETGGAVEGSGTVLFDGTVVIGSRDDIVYWLKDGVRRFEYKTNGDIHTAPVLLSDGSIVIGSDDYGLYWLKDGVKNFEFQGQVRSSPAVLSDDTIVIGVGVSIYWIKNGIKRFEFQKDGETYSSPVVLQDGTVVVGADNGRRYDNGRLFWLD